MKELHLKTHSPKSKENRQIAKRSPAPMSRKAKFQSILLDKNFEPENPKSLEELTEETCKWPIGHPNEEKFYFCNRKPESDFPYCKLHVLYKNQKEDVLKEDGVPEFIEKESKISWLSYLHFLHIPKNSKLNLLNFIPFL